jgi:hypothetical protein
MPRRTLAAAAAVAVAGTALVPLLAGAASAALPAPTDYAVVVADQGDGNNAVYRFGPSGRVTDTGGADSRNLDTVAASRDGGRYTFVREDQAGSLITSQILVRDADGTVVRIVDKHTVNLGSGDFAFDANSQLSPDGSEVIWTQYIASGSRVQRANIATGAVTTVAGSTRKEAWGYLTPTTLIAFAYSDADNQNCTGVQTLPVAGGSPIAVAGVTCADGEYVVSPSGTKVAWTHQSSTSSDIKVADLSVAVDGTATLSNITTRVTDGNYNESPVWSHDGLTLTFVKEEAALSDLWTVPADGSASPTRQSTSEDEYGVANIVRDGTAPTTTVTTAPFLLAGTKARLYWTLGGSDADLSGIQVTRTGGTGGTVTTRLPGAVTTYVDSGLAIGTTYTYSIAAVDHSGNTGAPATRQLTAIQPYASVPDPTTSISAKETFPVALPPQGTYGVRVRTNSGAPTTWIAPDGVANHGGGHTFAGKRGTSYAFLVTSRDAFGNASAETSGSSTVVPLDQTSAAYHGNTAPQALAGQYLGSARLLRAAGAYGQITVRGNRFQVIGDRCGSCGIFDVYVNGVRVAGIDSRNAAHQVRQVLYSRPLNPAINSTIVIKARGTAGRPNVVLDGFAVRR